MGQNTIQNLVGNRDAIRRIMAMDSNGTMDKIAESARENGTLSFDGEGAVYQPNDLKTPKQQGPLVVNEQVMNNHRFMPKAILESFRENPGQEASLSVLGNVDTSQFTQQNNIIPEQKTPPTNSSAIDYSLLKSFIDNAVQENVKKYMSALSKKLLNESKSSADNNVQAVKLGNTFSFITSKGDVYEATLKYKTNIQKKLKD